MSLRTPRFKNEFLAMQNIKMDRSQNLIIRNDLSSQVDTAIVEHLKTNSLTTFGILDFSHTPFKSYEQGRGPIVFDKDIGKNGVENKGIIFPILRDSFSIKYFLTNNKLQEEEELSLFIRLIKNSLLCTQYLSFNERLALFTKENSLNINQVADYIRYHLNQYYISFGSSEDIRKIEDRFRYINRLWSDSNYDGNLNLCVGTQRVSYSDLTLRNKNDLYIFVYAYLYRLYDLAINKKNILNICIVINGLRRLLDLKNYQTFYITPEEAKVRQYKIKSLLIELLASGKDYGVNFILMDMDSELFDEVGQYGFTIDSNVGGFYLDF